MSLDIPVRPSPSDRHPKPGLFRRIAGWPASLWAKMAPDRRTRRAISWSIVLAIVAFGGWYGHSRFLSHWGPWADIGMGAGVVLVAALLAPIAVGLVGRALRFFPTLFGQLGFGAFVAGFVTMGFVGIPPTPALIIGGTLVLLPALIFGSLAAMTSCTFKDAGFFKKAWVALCLLAGLGGSGVVGWWLTQPGSDEHIVSPVADEAGALPAQIVGEDPGKPGAYTVQTMFYGSGTDKRREEFGGDKVRLRTEPVNGKPFASTAKGWKGKLREDYWGFDITRLPVNGRVWYPAESAGSSNVAGGKFPLVLVVHGNHHMADYSDPGYAYLGRLMASRGFIFVSVDENFLNSGGTLFGGMRGENDCRGWMMLQHLKVWREWNKAEGNMFLGHVDMDNIGLIGHSRGGEAVCHAAVFNKLDRYPEDASVKFDFGFNIKGVVAIAPSDGQYRPAGRYAIMEDVSFLTLQGGHDADVSSFVGARLYQRLRFSKAAKDQFKASVFIYRANHGQFNTVWGVNDTSMPFALMLNHKALLSGDEQRQIGSVYMSAFFETTLKGRQNYLALFRDYRAGREWLPKDVVMASQFEDPSYRVVADFEEDFDVTTTTVAGGKIEAENLVIWREADIKLRSGGRRYQTGAFLGWNAEADKDKDKDKKKPTEIKAIEAAAKKDKPASYTLTLPRGAGSLFGLNENTSLVLRIASADEKPKAKDYSAAKENNNNENQSGNQESQSQESQSGGKKNEDKGNNKDKDKDKDEDGKKTDKDKPAKHVNLSVELWTTDGRTVRLPLHDFGAVLPPLKSTFTRSSVVESRYKKWEPVLQTIEIPLRAFQKADATFKPESLSHIRLVFDGSKKGVVILGGVGFTGR